MDLIQPVFPQKVIQNQRNTALYARFDCLLMLRQKMNWKLHVNFTKTHIFPDQEMKTNSTAFDLFNKGSHQKNKKLIFSDFVRKREGGSRTKPTFLHKDNLGSNFKGRGAKLLFPKSKFHLVWFLGLYPNFILSQSHMFCSGTGD